MTQLPTLDLFSGILGFKVARDRNGHFSTTACAEIDSYNCKLIDQKFNLDNRGDVRHIAIPTNEHPCSAQCETQDTVPCEETGFSSICFEDFMEGALPFPKLITGG